MASKYTLKHLKTDSLESLKAECKKVGLVNNDGEIITASHNHHLFVIGTIYEESGEFKADEEGNEIPVIQPIDGYYANLKYKKDVGLNHLAIEVETPQFN